MVRMIVQVVALLCVCQFNLVDSFTIVLDTWSGLTNQMGDLNDGINFCIYHNLTFSVRNSAFRKEHDLSSWYHVKFERLFDSSFLNSLALYVDFNLIESKMVDGNTLNRNGAISVHRLFDIKKPLFAELMKLPTKYHYVVLKQCFIRCAPPIRKVDLFEIIKPSIPLIQDYKAITSTLFYPKEKYNFLHYRYEKDFTKYFHVQNYDLITLINNIKYMNNSLRLYVAGSGVDKLLTSGKYDSNKILFKKDSGSKHLNFEEWAMIDLLIGKEAEEVFGHNLSMFSNVLNNYHHTLNYYNA